MSVSFKGAKKYTKNNGFSLSARIKSPLPAPVYFIDYTGLEPFVNVGDYVTVGQKIADIESYDSVPVHSSISGRVLSISDNTFTIENDLLFAASKSLDSSKSADSLTTRELLWIIRESAVIEVTDGVPAHVLLSPKRTPKCVIVRCFDSDPYVSSPQMITLNNTEKILKGLDIAMRILNVKKAIIGVENDTKQNFYDFKKALRYNENISLYLLKARYPQSDTNILTKTLIGRDYDKSNVVMLSAETLYNISNIFESGLPITTKIVTVSGDDILPPNNYRVPVGLPISSLLADCGYIQPQTVITGGIIKGKVINDFDLPITLQTTSIIAFNDNANIPKYRKELIK